MKCKYRLLFRLHFECFFDDLFTFLHRERKKKKIQFRIFIMWHFNVCSLLAHFIQESINLQQNFNCFSLISFVSIALFYCWKLKNMSGFDVVVYNSCAFWTLPKMAKINNIGFCSFIIVWILKNRSEKSPAKIF